MVITMIKTDEPFFSYTILCTTSSYYYIYIYYLFSSLLVMLAMLALLCSSMLFFALLERDFKYFPVSLLCSALLFYALLCSAIRGFQAHAQKGRWAAKAKRSKKIGQALGPKVPGE